MMLERSPARDAAIAAMLPLVEEGGWTRATLHRAAGRDADLLFSGRAVELVEAYSDLADRWMTADAVDLAGLRLPERVRTIIGLRLARNASYKAAVRQGLAVLGAPGNALAAMRCTGRTLDAIWYAAGDRSADFSWYTKRATLAGLYGGTVLHWLQDEDPAAAATMAFLDRGLNRIGQVGRLRRSVQDSIAWWRSPFRADV